MNKYRNKKFKAPDGTIGDSKKENYRYAEVAVVEKSGHITELKRQVKFVLIPAQYEQTDEVYTKGPRKGQKKDGKLLEREVAYYADFTYKVNGNRVVEDTKGMITKEYILKRKMMLYFYGISIREVRNESRII